MVNISPAEHSHGIDLESALDFLNTLHPGHGRTDEQQHAPLQQQPVALAPRPRQNGLTFPLGHRQS